MGRIVKRRRDAPKVLPGADKERIQVHYDRSQNFPKKRPRPEIPYSSYKRKYNSRTLARFEWIRLRLAEGYTDSEIVAIAQTHPIFEFAGGTYNDPKLNRVRVPTYWTLRRIIMKVKAELRRNTFDGQKEIVKAYDRYIAAFRLARKRNDPKAMALAQRGICVMLGLKQVNSEVGKHEAERVMDQLREMQELSEGEGTVSED